MANNQYPVDPVEVESEPSLDKNVDISSDECSTESDNYYFRPRSESRSGINLDNSTGGKRAAEVDESVVRVSKRSKETTDADLNRSLFQRKWSEEDEIKILRGLKLYSDEKGLNPLDDLNSFNDFMKPDLQTGATGTQFRSKVWSLHRKFKINEEKEAKGKLRKFSKAHEMESFELSKSVWGAQNGVKDVEGSSKVGKARNKTSAADDANDAACGNVEKNVGLNDLEENVVRNRAEGDQGRVEGRSERELQLAEIEIDMELFYSKSKINELESKKLEIMYVRTKRAFDVSKANDS